MVRLGCSLVPYEVEELARGVDEGGSPRTAAYATFGSQELADNVIKALKGRNAA